jgi:hypothetical protein
MWKYVAILAVLFGLTLYVARQDKRAAQQAAQKPAHLDSKVASGKTDEDHSQENIPNPEGYTPSWYGFFRWPNGVTTWAILLTLMAIAEQVQESRKATQAMRDSIPLQRNSADAALKNAQAVINSERAWLDIDFVRSGTSTYEFRLTNHGKTPAFVIWQVLGRTYWNDGVGEIPIGFAGTQKETMVLNNLIPNDGRARPLLRFDVSKYPQRLTGRA